MSEPVRFAFGRDCMDQRMRRREIALILDVVAEVPQRFHDARGSQHGRPHRRAGRARACLDRRTENGDRPASCPRPLPSRIGLCACLPAQDRPLGINRCGAMSESVLSHFKGLRRHFGSSMAASPNVRRASAKGGVDFAVLAFWLRPGGKPAKSMGFISPSETKRFASRSQVIEIIGGAKWTISRNCLFSMA